MSINAVIDRIETLPSGHVRLWLEPFQGDGPGQSSLTVLNPPAKHFDAVVGTHIWGDYDWIYVGKTKWAKRLGHARIALGKVVHADALPPKEIANA